MTAGRTAFVKPPEIVSVLLTSDDPPGHPGSDLRIVFLHDGHSDAVVTRRYLVGEPALVRNGSLEAEYAVDPGFPGCRVITLARAGRRFWPNPLA